MAKTQLIEARILKGFRDALPYGPQGEKRRRRIMQNLSQLFEISGFDPIDTPALEFSEILLGKAGGETEKQIYRFQDSGGRDVALRFDLTVPFARFMVQHEQQLNLPFKRYHIAKVWRGENAQKGRYREFYQCDFDIVGDNSLLADLCVLQMAHNALNRLQSDYPALENIIIHINHRSLLATFWQLCGVTVELQTQAMRIMDKLHKVGEETVYQSLGNLLGPKVTQTLVDYLGKNSKQTSFTNELERLRLLLLQVAYEQNEKQTTLPAEAIQTLTDLQQISDFAIQNGVQLRFDPSIARGLDYYTGMVFETFLEELPSLGSICSGGRYDQLTSLYSTKSLPGVGGSIGLDRLLCGLELLETSKTQESAKISGCPEGPSCLIISLDPNWKNADASAYLTCLHFSQSLQQAGLPCDVVPHTKKMHTLFQRAETKNSYYLLLLQPDYRWQLRKLASRESLLVASVSEILQQIFGKKY